MCVPTKHSITQHSLARGCFNRFSPNNRAAIAATDGTQMFYHIVVRNFALLTIALLVACEGGGSSSGGSSNSVTGRGGSTARMTISGDYLYAISSPSEVQLFNITQADSPSPWVQVPIGRDIETLFPYGDYLLIGAASGMFIMDNRDPANPQYLSEFAHATARDPVVAHEGYAYVTLKSDQFGNTNQMDVIDIRDITNPRLARTIAMQGPSGLTVGSDDLYVCDDVAGIKIFDLSDPANPSVIDNITDVNCNDVIADRGILYVITDDSLIQYDYTQTPAVKLSTLSEEAG